MAALPIRIDLSDVVQEFTLNQDESNLLATAIIDSVVQEYSMKWVTYYARL